MFSGKSSFSFCSCENYTNSTPVGLDVPPTLLTLRPTGLSSPAYRDWLDYVSVADGRAVGRIYEDRHTLPDLSWSWSITVYVDPKQGMKKNGRV